MMKDFAGQMSTLLDDDQRTAYDFHQLLEEISEAERLSFPYNTYVSEVFDEGGHNLLERCIKKRRGTFLKVLMVHGLIDDLLLNTSWRVGDDVVVTEHNVERMVKSIQDRSSILMSNEMRKIVKWARSMDVGQGILKACRNGDIDNVKEILNGNDPTKITSTDSQGWSCLHWAVLSDNVELVNYVRNKWRARVSGEQMPLNNVNQTPLHVAVSYGRYKMVDSVVNTRDAAYVKECNVKKEKCVVCVTASNGDVRSLEKLLKHNLFDECPNMGHVAAEHGRYEYIKYVVDKGMCDVRKKNKDGKSMLMLAVENGYVDACKFLLQHDFDLTDVDNDEENVFHHCALKGNVEIAKLLVEKMRQRENGTNDLKQCLNKKNKYNTRRSSVILQGTDKGRPAWHYVHLCRTRIEYYKTLAKSGTVDANKVGEIIRSGWGIAPSKVELEGYAETYEAKCMYHGKDDVTPTMLAISRGNEDVTDIFIDSGGNIFVKDCMGQTLMHMCAMRGTLNTAVKLKNLGLSVCDENHYRETPADIALINQKQELVDFLSTEARDHSVRFVLDID